MVERRRRAAGRAPRRRRARDRARPRSTRTSGPPSSWIRTAFTAADYPRDRRASSQRLARGARARRDRRGAGRAVRRDRAAHPRAPRARPLRRHALHDGAARGLVPSRDAARRRAHRRLGGALLLRARAGAPPPGHGRLPRYTWYDAYAELREKLDALGRQARRRVPRARRREPARRPRGGGAQRASASTARTRC